MTCWLPPGPSAQDEFERHADHCVKKTCSGHGGDIRGRRMCSLLEHGIALHTDFSGAQGAEMAMKMTELALRQTGLTVPWLLLYRASESNAKLVKNICSLDNPLRPKHVYKKVEDIHDPSRVLPQVSPLHSSLPFWDKVDHNEKHKEELKKNDWAFFCKGKMSYKCLVHDGAMCPCRFGEDKF
eukprot:8053521-Pyramimonas_sp.AAC.1